jgi:hypothetical protein
MCHGSLKPRETSRTRQQLRHLRVPDAEMDDLLITRADFHGEWNYTLHPRPSSNE